MRSLQVDLAIVGAGPAGLAAARAASAVDVSIAVIDDNPAPGGQIWRNATEIDLPPNAQHLAGTTTVGCASDHVLLLETQGGEVIHLAYRKLILATGARERFIPFPGWTLPNVMGAGGLQAMVKNGLPVEGRRIIVAGSGPLLLAVAAYLRKKGADVLAIAEQATWTQVASLIPHLSPAKLWQGAGLKLSLLGVPFWTSSWPTAAHGTEKLQSVTLQVRGRTLTESCDYLACGFGLIPNTELAAVLGCRIEQGAVAVDASQQTSIPDIYAAGEITGIAGVDAAIAQGQAAARAATGQPFQPANNDSFRQALERAYPLRPELKRLATPETLICRCEDVPRSRLEAHHTWKEAKLQTRCGMGPCQARICGPATEFLLGWPPGSIRPPITPTTVATLASMSDSESPAQAGA